MGYWSGVGKATSVATKGSSMSKFNQWQRVAFVAAVLSLGAALSACTTIEGTNALVDPATFEREVATNTLQGLGVIEREKKEHIETPRAPLALPKDSSTLPPPQEASVAEQLPEDSDKVQIDSSTLSDEDIRRLRNARVFDARSISGRPLTAQETARLQKQMASNLVIDRESGERSLALPPDEYFTTTAGGQDLVCLAANGDLVPLNDPACPPEIRAALQAQNN